MKPMIRGILSLIFLLSAFFGRAQETITPKLKLEQGGSQEKCAGESVAFNVKFIDFGDMTYNLAWRKVGEDEKTLSTEIELALDKLTADSSGQYYCELLDIVNSVKYYSDTVTLAVNEYLSGLPAEINAVIGEQAELVATLTEGVDYTWQALSPHAVEKNKIVFSSVRPPARDEVVSLTAVYKGCTFTSATTLRVVHAKKEVTAKISGDTKSCAGVSLAYTVAVTGEDAYAYSWCKVGGASVLSTTTAYTIDVATPAHSGKYYCAVYDQLHDLTHYSDTLDLSVYAYPGARLVASSLTPCYKSDVELSAGYSATGSGMVYRWKKQGKVLQGTMPSRIERMNETADVAYKVYISNHGCEDSAEVTLRPVVPPTGLTRHVAVSIGEPVSISATLREGAVYTWKMKDDYTVNDAGNVVSFTATTKSDSVYLLSAYGGCSMRDTALLVKSHADVNVDVKAYGYTRVCVGDSLNYYVTVSEESEYTYAWYKLGGGVVASEKEYTLKGVALADGGRYYCEVYDKLFDLTFYSDTLEIAVSDYPGLAATANGVAAVDGKWMFCRDTDVELKMTNTAPGQPNAKCLWTGRGILGNPGENSARVIVRESLLYKALMTNNGCVREDSFTIVSNYPEVRLPEKLYGIAGENITVSGVGGKPSYTYAWTPVGGASSSSSSYTFVVPAGITRVILDVEEDGRCRVSDTCYVEGLPAMSYETSLNDGYVVSRNKLNIIQADTAICARSGLVLEVEYTGYDGYTYEWMKVNSATPVDTGRVLHIASVADAHKGKYYCRVADLEKGGFLYSDTVDVKVIYRPSAQIVSPENGQSFCAGTDISFTGKDAGMPSASNEYVWSGAGIRSGGNTTKLEATVGTNGYYRFTVTYGVCSDTADILIAPIIRKVDIPSDMILAQPSPKVDFAASTAMAGGLFSWFVNGVEQVGASSSRNAGLDLRATGNVVVKMQQGGCDYYDTCRILMRPFTAVTESPDDGFAISCPVLRVTDKEVNVCEDGDVSLSVVYLGYDRYRYEWRKVGDNFTNILSDSITYTIHRAPASASGQYYCRAFNPDVNEYIYSDTLTLAVNEGPVAWINSPADGARVCYGSEVTLTSTTGYAPGGSSSSPDIADRLEWSGGSSIISGQGTQELHVRIGEEGGVYTLKAIKDGGCSSEMSIHLVVVKPQIDIPYVYYRNDGSQIPFSAKRDLMNLEVEWFVDGALAAKSRDEVLLDIQQDASVVARMTTSEMCVAEDTCRIFIKGATTFEGGTNDGFILSRPRPLIPSESKFMNVCPDSLVTLRVVHAEYPYFKYEWRKSGDPAVVATGREYTFRARSENTGFYYCTVIDSDLANDAPYIHSDTMRLTVYDGTVAELTASVNGEIISQREICPGTDILLDASLSASGAGGVVAYQWFRDGFVIGGETSSSLAVAPLKTVEYMVKAGNGECFDTTLIHFTVTKPTLDLPGRLQLSRPESAYAFDVTVPDASTVAWSFLPENGAEIMFADNKLNLTGDGWVFARITRDGCTGIDTCRVFVKDVTTFGGGDNDGFHMLESSTIVWIEPQMKEQVLCLDNSLKLTAHVKGLGKYAYMWHRVVGGVTYPMEENTDTVLLIHNMDETKAGRFFCEVTDVREMGAGKIIYRTDTVTVSIKDGPIAKIDFVDGNAVSSACFGDEFELYGSNVNPGIGSGQLTYAWSGDVYGRMGDDQHITARPQTTGRYVLEVKDLVSGCSDTVTLNLKMNSPQVNIPQNLFMYTPGTVEIAAETEGTGAFKWYIDYRSQVKSEENPGVLTIDQDALVIVEFLQNACSGFDTMRVFVKSPMTFVGGLDDGFVMSSPELRATVAPQFLSVCRGTDIKIDLNVNAEGRSLKYQWMKVGSASPVSYEKNFLMRANKMADAGKYYCLVSDPAEEIVSKRTITSDTAEVTMINGPIAKIVSPDEGQKVCDGIDIVIDASGTEKDKVSSNDEYVYEWFGAGITYTGLQYIVNARTGEHSQYIVKASLGECSTYDTVNLNVYRPDVEIPPVVFLADEGEVSLKVANPDKNVVKWYYYYDFDLSKPTSATTADSVKYLVTEDARVIVERQANQCSGYDTCHIFVKDIRGFQGKEEDGFVSAGTSFYIKNPEFSNNVCVGEAATIYVKVVGNDFYNYEWRKSGSEKIYSNAALCRIDPVAKSDEGYYYCVITDVNNNYSQTSNRIYLTVKEVPVTGIKASQTSVCYGEELTLEADRDGLKPEVTYSYLWRGDGVKNNTAASTAVKPEEGGEYVLVVGDGDCFFADTISLSVERGRLELPLVYHIKSGDNLTLKATVNGKTAPLDWKVNGNPYRNTPTVALTNLTKTSDFTVQTTGTCRLEQAGRIYVRDNGAYSGGYDDGFTMPNNLPQILDQCDLVLGCNVDTAVLWLSALWMEDLGFEWQKYDDIGKRFERCQPVAGRDNVSGFETDTLRFTSIFADDEGLYRCALSTKDGTTYSREIRLVKGGTPEIKVHLKDGAVCVNSVFQLGITVNIPQNGTKTGLEYGWYFARDDANFSQILPAVDYNKDSYEKKKTVEKDEGFYMVKVSNFCGVAYDTAFQEIWEAPTFVEQPGNQAVCINGSIELSTKVQGGGHYGYSLWQVEVDDKGKFKRNKRLLYGDTKPAFVISPAGKIDDGYFVWYVSNECDSVRSNPFRLTVEEEIIPVFQGVDTTVCASTGLNLVLLADKNVANNPPAASMQYYWAKDGVKLPGSVSTRHTISRVSPSDAGVYTCYAYHSCREKPIKQYTVKTKAVPVITYLTHDLKPYYCEGENIQMRVDYTSDAGDVSCAWFYNYNRELADGGRLSGAHTPLLKINDVVASDAGYYEVELKNQCGKAARSSRLDLKVNTPARYTASGLLKDTVRLCAGESTVLRVTATGMEPILYTWKKGEKVLQSGTSASLNVSNVTHASSGDYFCSAQNDCSDGSGVTTKTFIDVMTPLIFDIHIDGVKKAEGHYCGNDGVIVSLSGFEKRVVYTLYRRSSTGESAYVPVKVVRGDTVKTPQLTFGNMGYGLYHVGAVAANGVKNCETKETRNEIAIIRDATPEQFDFYVSDPMCTGETNGILTLSGSENNPDIEYRPEVYWGLDEDGSDLWAGYGTTFNGNGLGNEWIARAAVYRIMATNIMSGCEVQIGHNDTIAERPYPELYKLYAEKGDTTACYGMDSDVVLSLTGSQKECSYTLYKNGLPTDRKLTGNLISWDTVTGGVYTVKARTNYGCEKVMKDTVTVTGLKPLEQYIFSNSSSIVFCEENTGGGHLIALEGSSPGIRYDFYSRASEIPQSATWGTGGHLTWNVNLDGDSVYYVVAVDTLENCRREMANRVEIRANHLQVVTESPIKVSVSTQAKLKVDISNPMGEPQVDWQPAKRIVSVEDGTYTATTEILESGDRFMVTVSDSFCMKEAFIDLSVTGEALKATIKASDCYNSIDTLYVCEGDKVSLCSYISGGGGVYKFKWSDDLTDSIPVAQKSKLTYDKAADGFVVLYVESKVMEEGVPVMKMSTDTVRVIFRARPVKLDSENSALTCALVGQDAPIMLKKLEAGVNYRLEHQADLGGKYELVAGSEHIGAGNDTTYLIPFSGEKAGMYRVTATKEYGTDVCSRTFDVTELRQAPQHKAIRGEGVTEYCADTRMDSIYIDGSELNVTYRLLRNKKSMGKELKGTGENLLFAGPYSSDVFGKNTYQAVAVIGRCVDTLDNSIDITSHKRPVITSIEGMQDYCVGQPVTVIIPVPVQGVNYSLYKTGQAGALLSENASIEPVEFSGAQTAALLTGNYFVVAKSQDAMACTDTAKGLVIAGDPKILTDLNNKVGYCDNLQGYDGHMFIGGADSLLRYELFDAPVEMATRKSLGDFSVWKGDTIYYNGTITVPAGQSQADYYVYAHAGGCSKDVAQFRVSRYTAPLDCQLRWDLLGCVGYDLKMGIQSSEKEVTYRLCTETAGKIDTLATDTGTGGHLDLGTYNTEGVYYVLAVNKGGCERRLTQEYRIRPLPDFYKIYTPGKSAYCEGERGVQIGITGTQQKVTYNLQVLTTVNGKDEWKNVASGSELLGTGSGAQLFSGYYQAGRYRVVSDYCGLPMLDELDVTGLPLPKMAAVNIEGKACVDSTMSVRVEAPEAGTEYSLYYEKQPTDLGALSGSDVAWKIDNAKNGAYTVVANRAGCQLTLVPEIRPGQAVRFGELNGMTAGMCAETTTDLYLAAGDWDNKAKYALRMEGADSAAYAGTIDGAQMQFKDVPAGHNYYVVASHLSCETQKGVYKFAGITIPVIEHGDFAVEDCKPDGEAFVMLKNLVTDYQYILKGLMKTDTIKDCLGDTVVRNLSTGSYTYRIYDTKTECYSLPLDTVIRRAVSADSIVSKLAYCEGGEGVTINLSGQTFGVNYTLKRAATGEEIETMTAATAFRSVLPEGEYVYYRERVGLWGGCWLADTFEVQKYPNPLNNLTIEAPKTLCETGDNSTIIIQNSELDVAYMLQNAVTRVDVDTIQGNGGAIAFSDRRPEGVYNIVMSYKGLCPASYYKSFNVNPVPPKITASDCRFCADVVNQCELDVKNLKTAAEYVLYNHAGIPLDSIHGLNAGYFDKQPAGEYFVIGTYPATGCADRVAEMAITEVTRPKVFRVNNAAGNGLCEDFADVRLSAGCEGDSVKYYLYMNDYFKLAGPVTAVNGEVKFGKYREVGSYRIYAEKGDGICGAWMDGSVVIYAAPSNARLSVTGIDCSGGVGGDVVVTATKTVRDWQYYISDGTTDSEKQVGVDGVVLNWTKIGDKVISAGKYKLYAMNACDTILLMDSITVKSARKPQIQHFKRTQEGIYCKGDQYDLVLQSGQKGVKYSLAFGEQKWDVDGVDANNGLFLRAVENKGLYSVSATVDSTGCSYFMDTLTIREDSRPQKTGLVGSDTCVSEPGATFVIGLKVARVPKVDYYLEVNGKYVDTLLRTAPMGLKTFKPQSEYGCYTVVAASESGYCDTREEAYCMSKSPEPTTGLVGGERSVALCDGISTLVEVEKSDVGISYVLVDGNGDFCAQPVKGNGDKLTVGSVSKAGTYSVTAFVSKCAVSLEDTLKVSIRPRPLLNIPKYYSYAQGGQGVEIKVLPETSDDVVYGISNAVTGDAIYWETAKNGQELVFEGLYKEGRYVVATVENTGTPPFACVSSDTIEVEEIKLTPFRLEVIGTPYKCEPLECRSLKLSGSEKGASYSLYRRAGGKDHFIALVEGTGKAIDFNNQCDTGYFYIMAEKRISEDLLCQTKMGADVHIYVSTIIEKYLLSGDMVGYCGSEPRGRIVLDSSQTNTISYQLYCNGRPVPGKTLAGKGGSKLAWDKLEGLECVENNDVGNVYSVVATDGHCEVPMAGRVNIVRTNNVSIRNQDLSFDACTGQKDVGISVKAHGCMLSYEWTHDGVVVGNDEGYVIDSMRMEDLGVYVCKVSNYCGSLVSEPIHINVREVVQMKGKMEDKLVCGVEAQDIQLVSKAWGGNYAWFRVGSADTLSHTSILEIRKATAEKDAGEYVCNTWNACGGMADTVKVEFNRVPQVTGFTYRTDTLCVGTPFSLTVNSRDSLVWYVNNKEIVGKHDKRLNFGAVELSDEGEYRVKAVNNCAERDFNLVKLLVDDSIKIISAPERSKHYCENSTITLKLETQPSDRVSYLWLKRLSLKGTGNTLSFNANYISEDGAWYTVQHRNKCSAGEISQTIFIDRAINLEKLTSPDIVCTDASEKKMIIVKDKAQSLPEYNHYKWYRRVNGVPVLVVESDTLIVKRKLSERGVYYAEVKNSCQTVNSNDVDLRIDSLPVITKQPEGVVVCESGSAVLTTEASGGDLWYDWYLEKKSGNRESTTFQTIVFNSSSRWPFDRLTTDYDSAKIWCVVRNDCGFALSDTVMLRVTKNIRLSTDKQIASLCANAADDEVKIAVIPYPQLTDYWNYYVEKDGVLIHNPKAVYGAYTDTLKVKEPGIYRIYGFETKTTSCVSDESSVNVVVSNREIGEVTLSSSGKTVMCRNEKVNMRLRITKGEAPWRVDIRRKGDSQPAPELGGEPIIVYSRDTILTLSLLSDQTFYVASASQFMDPNACACNVTGEVFFEVQQPYDTRLLEKRKKNFGSCKTIDLADALKPQPDASIGKFYINGKPAPDNLLSGKPDKYMVTYKTETSAGCASADSIEIWLDSLPTGKMSVEKTDLCSGEITNVLCEFDGKGAFDYQIAIYSYDEDGKLLGRPSLLRGNRDSYVAYPVSYDEKTASKDAMRLYELLRLTDANGCSALTDANDSIKIMLHKSPTFYVTGMHPAYNNNQPTESVTHFEVPASDKRVWFTITKSAGTAPWNCTINYEALDSSKNQVFEHKGVTAGFINRAAMEAGTYTFSISDAHCSSRAVAVRKITHLDTGYIRVKVALEGAYNKTKHTMVSGVFEKNLVPVKDWKAWPKAVQGDRKGVDWVTVQLRKDGVNGGVVFSQEYLLLNDGAIVDRYGRETLPVPNVDFNKEYYVVVKHRNHLPVGSKFAYKLNPVIGTEELVDLTQFNEVYKKVGDITEHMTFVDIVNGKTIFAMVAGNVFLNSLISIENASATILNQGSLPGYYTMDVDFDGMITIPEILSVPDVINGRDDVSKVYNNRDKYSEIKE